MTQTRPVPHSSFLLSRLGCTALLVAWVGFPAPTLSQTQTATPPGQAPCGTPDHRAFDFWLGEWDVYRPDGTLAGRNRITREIGGCVLHERYAGGTPEQPYYGESFNVYDASRGVWHQSWVDTSGLLLVIEGGIREGAMVLEGTVGSGGAARLNRITWTVLDPDGNRVRQHWETSADGGETWTTAFDGEYRRRGT